MEFLKKNWAIILMVLFALMWVNSCTSNSSNAAKVRDQVVVIDSLKTEIVETAKFKEQDFERLVKEFEIAGYEVSGRMLYDNNAIIRRTTRPDDKMREYQVKIDELTKELEGLKND